MLGHADGICHLFIDIEANLEMALSVALDSKIQYPAACNAIETLLVHKDIAPAFLEKAIPLFNSNDVKLIGDKRSVLGHADGICHLFIDIEANLEMALSVALDSKIQYPAACNAIETLLVHKDIAPAFLEKAIPLFLSLIHI